MKDAQVTVMQHPQGIIGKLHIPTLSLDLEGRITGINPASERLFARRSSELIGQPFASLLDPASHLKADLMIEQLLEKGQVDDWELDHVRAGSDPILVGYSATLLRDDSGLPIGIIALGRDLSRQIDLTRQLAETNQQLEGSLLQLEKTHAKLKETQMQLVQSEKMRSLGQMVAGVAHEINNPAAFVANNLSHLNKLLPGLHDLFQAHVSLREMADAALQQRIHMAEGAVGGENVWDDLPDLVQESMDGMERIRKIVSSLRKFSHIDDLQITDADLNEELRTTIKMVKTLWNANIEINASYGSLPKISCQPAELNQVFLNLLTNAFQAVTKVRDRGTIWIESAVSDEHVVITIRDDGKGMDASMLARLGEPFFTTLPVGSGTGLGLAISLGIIEGHHGTLTFVSQPDKGTTATIRLPIHNELKI